MKNPVWPAFRIEFWNKKNILGDIIVLPKCQSDSAGHSGLADANWPDAGAGRQVV